MSTNEHVPVRLAYALGFVVTLGFVITDRVISPLQLGVPFTLTDNRLLGRRGNPPGTGLRQLV